MITNYARLERPPIAGSRGALEARRAEPRGLGRSASGERERLRARDALRRPGVRTGKRAFDVVLAVALGLALAPPMVLIACAIRLSSPGPILYGQRRLGRDGRHFRTWKFRTMVADADQMLDRLLAGDERLRAEWERDHKLRDDPRVTPIGRFLRRTSLDELPQLWNVLEGEMSLVGPRPIVDDELPKYGTAFPVYSRVRPGITGLWQVSGRSDTTYERRVELDRYYVVHWSPWLDLSVLLRTPRAVLRREGAC